MKEITEKEKLVLKLVAAGNSTKQIADQLGISFHTVESHRKNLRSKFDARNSTEMILKAVSLTLL